MQPYKTGLSVDQYKVYNDFAKLNSKAHKLDTTPFQNATNSEMSMQFGENASDPRQPLAQAKQEPAIYEFTLDSILARIEKKGALDSVSRSLMTLKL